MKSIFKWLAGVVGGAITIALVILLLPRMGGLLETLLPDTAELHTNTTSLITEKLRSSARLETFIAQNEATVTSNLSVKYLGTISETTLYYTYTGSYGIDLSQVELRLEGDELTFLLPEPALIRDDIVLTDQTHTGLPAGLADQVRLDEVDKQNLLQAQRQQYQEKYLRGEGSAELRVKTVEAVEKHIAPWLMEANDESLQVVIRWADGWTAEAPVIPAT